ncbi:septum formation inhibitor Maf [Psychrosphaera ytuae]|uniref:7-methyl-GTP pyrophosphatase n=1 Tax=Psychrosphaera ytuae TaxID=2820710 RepID=A0A975HI84_9GAMM|nr:nucleoside triphosphate pyrophosphatase [Psychrosphaera ytuae]QTH63960.1 septum formation inhibitor Maf [Psychrosphaera ytuae]
MPYPIENRTLVLGSTSPFRKAILEKLNISFITDKPEIDETPLDGELPADLVARLAESKALKVAERHNNAIIIGSDQVAVFNDEILGKPHSHENAVNQLTKFSDQTVTFLTGLTVIDLTRDDNDPLKLQTLVEPFNVKFKPLMSTEIENYLRTEQPYNCAGSFKSEALGICLFEKLQGDDPNSLVGLPLIKLVQMLNNIEFRILELQQKS